MPTIRVRLREIADAGLSSLRRASLLNLGAIVVLLVAALWIQQLNSDAARAARLALLAETQRGLVSRVASEIDLSRQAEIQNRFQVVSEELSARAAESGLDILAEVALARKHSDEIFAFAAGFGQQQAVAVIDGPFAAATDRIRERILDRTARADAAAFRAMVVMFVLGLAALVLQFMVGRQSERRLIRRMEGLANSISNDLEDSAVSVERVASGDLQTHDLAPQERNPRDRAPSKRPRDHGGAPRVHPRRSSGGGGIVCRSAPSRFPPPLMPCRSAQHGRPRRCSKRPRAFNR